jgi:hypothetical protein
MHKNQIEEVRTMRKPLSLQKFLFTFSILTLLVYSALAQTWGPGNEYGNFTSTQFPFGMMQPPDDYNYVSLGSVGSGYPQPFKYYGINVVQDGHSFHGGNFPWKNLNENNDGPVVLRILAVPRFSEYVRAAGLNDDNMPNFSGNDGLKFARNIYLHPDAPTAGLGDPDGVSSGPNNWCHPGSSPGDFNHDGVIDLFDCFLYAETWTETITYPCTINTNTLNIAPGWGLPSFEQYRDSLVTADNTESNSVFRWYVLDEPRRPSRGFDPQCIRASEFVLLNSLSKEYFDGRVMTALPPSAPFEFYIQPEIYTDFVQLCPDIKELVVDIYPYRNDIPATDNGTNFQQRLDDMCTVFKYAKTAAMSGGKDFWVIPQAHQDLDDNGIRTPTAREIGTQTYLALAHGANGILYFYMKTNDPDDQGLADPAFETQRIEVARLGKELNDENTSYPGLSPNRTLGHWLKTLVFVDAFPTHNPNGTSRLPIDVVIRSNRIIRIKQISKDLQSLRPNTEIGVFRDGSYYVYLFVVDRNPAAASGSNTVTITVQWEERDILNGQLYASGSISKAVLIGGGGLVKINNIFKISDQTSDNYTETSPTQFALGMGYPNPFNPSVTIPYEIAKPGMVSLKVYDIVGRLVRTLKNNAHSVGDTRLFGTEQMKKAIGFLRVCI